MGGRPDPNTRSTPLHEWPEADQTAWEAAQRPGDLLDGAGGLAASWRPETRAQTLGGYGAWLGWLERSGLLDVAIPLADRVTRDLVRLYLDAMEERGLGDHSIACRLQQLGDALRVMAPEVDWRWLGRAAYRLHSTAVPVKDIEACLRPPEEVLALGMDLMDAGDNGRFRTSHERAVLFRDGLLVAFLALLPLRMANLHGIRIGRHLQRRGEAWWVAFSGEEMKNHRPIEFPWPETLSGALDRYLEVHRANMLDKNTRPGGHTALWVSRNGTEMPQSALAFRIVHRTQEEFGVAINPHSFRHLAATTLATSAPENINDAARLLGHATLTTTHEHYIKAQTAEASRRFQSTIAAKRSAARGARVHRGATTHQDRAGDPSP